MLRPYWALHSLLRVHGNLCATQFPICRAQAAVSAQEVQQIPEQGPSVWGRRQASRGGLGLTLYLHDVIKWKSGSASVSGSRPLLALDL